MYDITGGTDRVIVVKFKGIGELRGFVKSISTMAGVENTDTHVVLNTTKEDFRLI